jgi:hypothetical protein
MSCQQRLGQDNETVGIVDGSWSAGEQGDHRFKDCLLAQIELQQREIVGFGKLRIFEMHGS